jgi:predicted alpha/beta hydrolase family esterase
VRRFLLLHGWQGSGPEHWQSWLAQRLRHRGEHVSYPVLPDPDVPIPARWGAALHGELAALAAGDGERIVLCHSLACVLWARETARIEPAHRVDRVALVAPPAPGVAPELAAFFPTGADEASLTAAAGATRLVCSSDDPYCPGGAAAVWGVPLGLEADEVPGGGHLNADAGFGPWPAMEAWALGERATLAAQAA